MRISPAGLELSLTSSRLLSCTNFASKILPYRASAQIALCLRFNNREKKETESIRTLFPFWAHSTKMQLALFYVIPFFTDFEISYRFVRNEKESFLKLIFYT